MWMIYILQIPLLLVGKVTGDKVGWEQEGQSCRTISSSGTKFGCGSMQHLKIWRETFLLADLKLLPFVL